MKRKCVFLLCGVLALCISCSNNSNEAYQVDLTLIPVKLNGKWGTNGKWGYITPKGEYLINLQFADADFFRDGLAKVVDFNGFVAHLLKDIREGISDNC